MTVSRWCPCDVTFVTLFVKTVAMNSLDARKQWNTNRTCAVVPRYPVAVLARLASAVGPLLLSSWERDDWTLVPVD